MTRVIYRDKVEMKTFTATPATIKREWFVVDATDKTLGRLATELAHRLRGKHKPTYTPNMDTGDHLIVVNAEKIKVTGKKLEDKIYYRHTGYIGNLKSINLGKMLETHPERVIQKAVKGMLPRNPLGRANFRKLHVYAGPDHPHTAQQPAQLEL
jgi:large subunit ribosomal protein L13